MPEGTRSFRHVGGRGGGQVEICDKLLLILVENLLVCFFLPGCRCPLCPTVVANRSSVRRHLLNSHEDGEALRAADEFGELFPKCRCGSNKGRE